MTLRLHSPIFRRTYSYGYRVTGTAQTRARLRAPGAGASLPRPVVQEYSDKELWYSAECAVISTVRLQGCSVAKYRTSLTALKYFVTMFRREPKYCRYHERGGRDANARAVGCAPCIAGVCTRRLRVCCIVVWRVLIC